MNRDIFHGTRGGLLVSGPADKGDKPSVEVFEVLKQADERRKTRSGI